MRKNGRPIQVLMDDGSTFMRKRLSMMLMKCSDLQVVGTAMKGRNAIEQGKRTQPDVMTLDIEMLRMIGFKSIRSYDGPSHTSQNIIVSTFEAEGSGVILQALARGAGDYIECRIVIWQWGRLLRRAV